MAADKQMSVYFKEDDTKPRLEKLSENTGKSSSEIVEALLVAALPTLEKKAITQRKFQLDVEIAL